MPDKYRQDNRNEKGTQRKPKYQNDENTKKKCRSKRAEKTSQGKEKSNLHRFWSSLSFPSPARQGLDAAGPSVFVRDLCRPSFCSKHQKRQKKDKKKDKKKQ